MSVTNEFFKGFYKENPVFRLALGLCPTLAVSNSVQNAIGMGAAATFVLLCSNVIVSLIRSGVPKKIRIPIYIVVIATFVTITDLVMAAFAPDLHKALGIFVPLIVVNCIILGRAEAFAGKNSTFYSFMDGLGMGIGFTL
ncbi:MAG: electron transport complex subunit RsxE, partial [bacterium]|nr:electron transport complex subunit RsxE [bacterium]